MTDVTPTNSGELTADQKSAVQRWLAERAPNGMVCPVCQTNSWAIGDHLLTGNIFTPGVFTVGGVAYPMTFIICNTCAHAVHFMALVIPGLVAPEGGKPPA